MKNKEIKEEFVEVVVDDVNQNYEKEKMKQLKKKYAKIFIPTSVAITAALVLAIVLPITLIPGNLPGDDVTDPSLIGISLTQEKMNKLAFETTTAVQSAVSVENVPILSVKKAFSEEEKLEVEEVLPAVDLILTNGSTFKSTLVESTNGDYSYEVIISYLDVSGRPYEYSMFFNILKDKTYKDEDETTHIVKYSGIMMLDMAGYEFVSTLTEEQEGHETESEMSTVVYLNASKTSYIQVEQSTENELNESEESFEYEVWEKGVLDKNFEITTEINKNKKYIETEVNDISYKTELIDSENKTIFKFSKEKDLSDFVQFEKLTITNPEDGSIKVTYVEI